MRIVAGYKVKNPPAGADLLCSWFRSNLFIPNHNIFSTGKVVLTRVCEYKVIF